MSKRIIYCADGTWNDPASKTNVYKIFKAMNFTAEQSPIYDDGVGSDGNTLAHLLGGAFGEGIDQKIRDGYTRLSHLYEHGDQIFLFGFSRGAYTARSLAGMIALCGLPTQHTDDSLTDAAYQAYRERDLSDRARLLAALKAKYVVEPPEITMIGVWDTVGALGVPAVVGGIDPLRYGFLNTKLSPAVKHAYHAVSIDERRREFPATMWDPTPAPGQTIEQVYFSGVHCDIGGGYSDSQLSDITLAWMMKKAHALGVDFDPATYAQYESLDAKHALDLKHESWSLHWLFPSVRQIDDRASISNSAQLRLQHDSSYSPSNLKHKAGVLAGTYSVVSIVTLPQAAAAGV
jgi:uncharacterized protein (DUF2235 family)